MTTTMSPGEARIAARLKLYRRLAGLTQRQAADKLGVAEKTINRWEGAETSGFMSELDRLAEAYGITRDELVSDDAGEASPGLEAQVAALAREVRMLRQLLLDPTRLAEAADKLIDEERRRGDDPERGG